jgi:hypothetical protein
MTKETATEEKVTEVTDEIKSVLNVAIKEVNTLVSSPLEGILGLLDVGGLGELIATLLNVRFLNRNIASTLTDSLSYIRLFSVLLVSFCPSPLTPNPSSLCSRPSGMCLSNFYA